MKVQISNIEGKFVVEDEFGLIKEEFLTQNEAFEFVLKKFNTGTIIKAILYVRKDGDF